MSEDDLKDVIADLEQRAEVEYAEDPLGSAIGWIEDLLVDCSPESEPGVKQALYTLKSGYIMCSGKFWCECTTPTPAQYKDGRWECEMCNTIIVESDESIV
jgi:hypothetical protein